MTNSQYYQSLIEEKFPNYNIEVIDITNENIGAIQIEEGVKVVITDEKGGEIFDSYQMIKGNIREKVFNWSQKDASDLLLSSINNVIYELEESKEPKEN